MHIRIDMRSEMTPEAAVAMWRSSHRCDWCDAKTPCCWSVAIIDVADSKSVMELGRKLESTRGIAIFCTEACRDAWLMIDNGEAYDR